MVALTNEPLTWKKDLFFTWSVSNLSISFLSFLRPVSFNNIQLCSNSQIAQLSHVYVQTVKFLLKKNKKDTPNNQVIILLRSWPKKDKNVSSVNIALDCLTFYRYRIRAVLPNNLRYKLSTTGKTTLVLKSLTIKQVAVPDLCTMPPSGHPGLSFADIVFLNFDKKYNFITTHKTCFFFFIIVKAALHLMLCYNLILSKQVFLKSKSRNWKLKIKNWFINYF